MDENLDLLIAETEEDVKDLLKFEQDPIEKYIEGTRQQWNDWLIANLKNPGVMIVLLSEDEQVKGYMVIFKSNVYPISTALQILYTYSESNPGDNKVFFDKLCDWCLKNNYKRISIVTDKPELMKRHFGFELTKMVEMEVRL